MTAEANAAVSWEQVLELVAQLDESGLAEAEVSYGDVSVRVSRSGGSPRPPAGTGPEGGAAAGAATAGPAERMAATVESAAAAVEDGPAGTPVPAPMVGVFYRSPAPGADPFVTEGQRIEADQTVGIIEVMKMMNPVTAGVSGTVAAFAARDAQAVEFGQTLLTVVEDS